MSLDVLIAGLGQIGMGYDLQLDPQSHVYTHARAFSLHPDFRLVGGVDPQEELRSRFEAEYRCPSFADLEEALTLLLPDLVVIAAPTPRHGETLQRILALSHPKAVLCEKPLSYSPEEAQRMLDSCAAAGIGLYVNYMRRCDPGALEIKRRIDAGEIGTPVKGMAWYSKGLLHNGSHFWNLLEFWLGPVLGAEVLDSGRLWDGSDPEPDLRLIFAEATVVFLAACEEAFSHYGIELLSPNGRLRYELGGERVLWNPALPDPRFSGYRQLSPEPELIRSGMERYQWHVVDQLAMALKGEASPVCTGADALDTLNSMQRILAR